MAKFRRDRGFTLIEMMIVVGVIAILIAIALPNFMKARDTAAQRSCLSSLRVIDQAKQQLALERGKKNGDEVVWGDVVPQYMRVKPVCPQGGTYTVGKLGTNPTCTVSGHELP